MSQFGRIKKSILKHQRTKSITQNNSHSLYPLPFVQKLKALEPYNEA